MNNVEEKLQDVEIATLKEALSLREDLTEVWQAIGTLTDLIKDLQKENASLKLDVEKLIENNNGGKRYGKSA